MSQELFRTTLASVLLIIFARVGSAQIDPFGDPTTPARPRPANTSTSDSSDDSEGETVSRPVVVPFGPRQVRLHLMDGSLIGGKLSIDTISVNTAFGELEVPIDKIRSLTPGLDSNPALMAKLDKLFNDLGGDDYQDREAARKELIGYGTKIQNELKRFKNDDNVERNRQIVEIDKALEELIEEQEDDFEEGNIERPWIRGDTIVTTEFTIVGHVNQESFKIASKYGPLNVKLTDVAMFDRTTDEKAKMRKSLTVDASNLVQRSFKASGIRVEKGDKIVVRASGSLIMTPWGNNMSSTPEGGQNFGWYLQNQIPGGALVAKIGSKGKEIKVGSRSTFTAKSSGMLQFGIAMQQQYANQSFPGSYKVRVRVEP